MEDLSSTASYERISSNDLDHYNAQPGGWDVQASQLSKGSFSSVIRAVKLPGIMAYDNHWACAALIEGQSPPGWYMLGASVIPERDKLQWCGKRLDRGVLACTSPGQEIEFSFAKNTHDVVLLVSPDLLQRAAGDGTIEQISQSRYLNFPGAEAQLTTFLLDLFESVESRPQLLQQPAVASRLRSTVLRAIEECFSSQMPETVELHLDSREKAVHLARKHVTTANGHTSAWDMAQAAGVSQKTLETAFKQILGITPGQYLRVNHLNIAHHQLAAAHRNDLSVTETAISLGFTNMGRFSMAYKDLFGESPSQTLSTPPRLIEP